MASQQQILEQLAEPMTYAELTEVLGQKGGALTKPLKALEDRGLIELVDGQYRFKGKAVEPEKLPSEKPPAEPALPSDYDEFVKIGQSIGVSGDFLKSIADFIFKTDPYDVEKVHQGLSSLHLRVDTASRWSNMWSAAIGKPAPKGAEAATPGAAATASAPQRFSVIAGRIIPDPNGVPYVQALQELEVRLANEGKKSSGESELLKAVLEELRGVRETMANQQFNYLKEAIVATNQKIDTVVQEKRETTRYGVVDHMIGGVIEEARGLRSDIKPLIQGAVNNATQRQLRPRTAEEKADFSEGLTHGIEHEMKLRKMEDKLFLGKDSGKAKTPNAPPPVPRPSVTYD